MKLLRRCAFALTLSISATCFAQVTVIQEWDATGATNVAWSIPTNGAAWSPMISFTAGASAVVTNAGAFLTQATPSAFSITYLLWSQQPNRINLNATGQPGFLGSATVTGSGISATGELVSADFSALNINMVTGQTYYLQPIAVTGSANWMQTGVGGAGTGHFYATFGTGSLTSASWTSDGLKEPGFSVTSGTPIPEPSAYAALAGALALCFVARHHRKRL